MEQNNTIYIDLISKYLFGEASPEEMRELEQWVDADPANASLFTQYHKTWEAVNNSRIEASTDLDMEFNALRSRVPRPASRVTLFLRAAAILLILLVPAFFLYQYLTTPAEERLVAGNGTIEQTLPDGTVVTLNADAVLSWPSSFHGSDRKVSLQGEAWFEVAHDRIKPFIIEAGNARIRVVGTTFFVNAGRENDRKEIILASGMLRVYYQDDLKNTELLHPGEKAEMIPEQATIVKSLNDDPNYLAWKTGRIVFSNTPLEEAVILLSKIYRADITLAEERLKDCRITATFDRQTLESVLHVLEATLDLQSRESGAGIQLSGRGCNPVR